MLSRRDFGWAWGGLLLAADAQAQEPVATQQLALAWRDPQGRDWVGRLQADWAGGRLEILSRWALPSRAHGLLLDGQGGFYAVAARAGDWLLRVDAQAQPHWLRQPGAERFNGHLLLGPAGLYATETDPRIDQACLAVYDPNTLALRQRWTLPGRDAHQFTLDAQGRLLLALGGIPRQPDGNKRALDDMAPALLRLDAQAGRVLDRWQLDDPRLSLRHLAWSEGGSQRLLGIALQAEHDTPERRREAPVLALFDGEQLSLPIRAADGAGYAGDICAAPGGGFVLSAQKAGRGLLWHPQAAERWIRLADLSEICALAAWQDRLGRGVVMLAQRGLARWHNRLGQQMLAWPEPLTPDNHALLLA